MTSVLISWIGSADLKAAAQSSESGLGPVAQAVVTLAFDHIYIVTDYSSKDVQVYIDWIKTKTSAEIKTLPVKLVDPTHFSDIYHAALTAIRTAHDNFGRDIALTFHLSPGTPAMMAVWILLAKTIHPATLIQSSKEQGVSVADIPFDISAEFIPQLQRGNDAQLEQIIAALPQDAPEFDDIVHRSPQMRRLIARARLAALHTVPVLIEGESGTGKELLARAIHRASERGNKPFVAVNCGAIPPELVESEFFGHKKGSFTGAVADRKGYFESAADGTIFLDEIGELPPPAQVKILRVLQEGELTRVGDTATIPVNARVIAATNRSLIQEVANGNFRADLFYRLAVAVLHIPPLRERQGDIGLLIEHVLANGDLRKKIFPAARNLLLAHPWPGNVRELVNTLRRASVWSTEDTLQVDDIRDALFPVAMKTSEHILGRSITDGFNVADTLAEVARHYLARAMEDAAGNKSRAAHLLGLPNYQTLTNWLKKYGLE